MNVLGMFARHPTPGKTKTRLAATIGDQAAIELYAAFVEDLLLRCGDLADSFVAAVTPEDTKTRDWFSQRLPNKAQLWFQPDLGLGERIEWFFRKAMRQPGDKAVLIGSDSPDLPGAIIESAFRELDGSDMVIAPANDGGFVLVGLKAPAPAAQLFANVAWSAPTTLLDTLRAALQHELSANLLQPWYDVDTVENLGTLMALQLCKGSGAAKCEATNRALSKHRATLGRWQDPQ